MPAENSIRLSYKRKELNTIYSGDRSGYSPKTSIHDTDCSYTSDDERGMWDSLNVQEVVDVKGALEQEVIGMKGALDVQEVVD